MNGKGSMWSETISWSYIKYAWASLKTHPKRQHATSVEVIPAFAISWYHCHHNANTKTPLINSDREREGTRPFRNLLPQLQDLGDLLACDGRFEVLQLVCLLGQIGLYDLAQVDCLGDIVSHPDEVVFVKASGRHSRRTYANTARCQCRLIAWNTVLVACNVDLLQHCLHSSTVKVLGSQIEQHHMAVSSIGDKFLSSLDEFHLQCLRVLDNLLLILSELWGGGLLQCHSKGSDGMVVRATLMPREDGEVDGALKIIKQLLASLGI